MAHKNRITPEALDPTPEQIAEECRRIQARWSEEMKRERKLNRRIDSGNPRNQANLRFLKFLAALAEKQS